MSPYQRHWLAMGTLLLGLGNAQAQNPARAARPDPLNAQAAVPALVHTSSFATYRRQTEAEPIGWREANDTVARIGGWRAYARESAAAAASAAGAGTINASGSGTPADRKP